MYEEFFNPFPMVAGPGFDKYRTNQNKLIKKHFLLMNEYKELNKNNYSVNQYITNLNPSIKNKLIDLFGLEHFEKIRNKKRNYDNGYIHSYIFDLKHNNKKDLHEGILIFLIYLIYYDYNESERQVFNLENIYLTTSYLLKRDVKHDFKILTRQTKKKNLYSIKELYFFILGQFTLLSSSYDFNLDKYEEIEENDINIKNECCICYEEYKNEEDIIKCESCKPSICNNCFKKLNHIKKCPICRGNLKKTKKEINRITRDIKFKNLDYKVNFFFEDDEDDKDEIFKPTYYYDEVVKCIFYNEKDNIFHAINFYVDEGENIAGFFLQKLIKDFDNTYIYIYNHIDKLVDEETKTRINIDSYKKIMKGGDDFMRLTKLGYDGTFYFNKMEEVSKILNFSIFSICDFSFFELIEEYEDHNGEKDKDYNKYIISLDDCIFSSISSVNTLFKKPNKSILNQQRKKFNKKKQNNNKNVEIEIIV